MGNRERERTMGNRERTMGNREREQYGIESNGYYREM